MKREYWKEEQEKKRDQQIDEGIESGRRTRVKN